MTEQSDNELENELEAVFEMGKILFKEEWFPDELSEDDRQWFATGFVYGYRQLLKTGRIGCKEKMDD